LNLTESIINKIDWSLFRRAVRSGTDKEISENMIEHPTMDFAFLLREAEDLYNTEGYNESLNIIDQALRINPSSADAWNRRGLALGKLDKHEEALKSYDKALEIDPKYADAWYNKGFIQEKLQNKDESIRSYEMARRLSSRSSDYY
jgi:tetratricopeptide (TPR) repeat protein